MNYENKETLLTTIEQQKAQGINYQLKSTEVKKTNKTTKYEFKHLIDGTH